MSSDDVASDRVSTEVLEKLIRPAGLDELRAWQENPVDYDIGAATVRDSVFGKLGLPVVWNGEVLIGSQIVDAERIDPKDGGRLLVIDLTPLGWSRTKAMAAAVGEMTAARSAYVDDKMLADLVTRLYEDDQELAAAAGWEPESIQELLDRIEADENGIFDKPSLDGDADDIPEERGGDPITRPGDVWQLGHHRVKCGSSADVEHLADLMAGSKADAMITDPPYGVDYGDTVEFRRSLGKTQRPADNSYVANDGLAEAVELWAQCFPTVAPFMAARSAFYCWSPGGDQQIDLGIALREAGFETHGMIIWVKSSFSFSRADHKYQHEPAFYGWPKAAVHDWHGPNNETTIWEYDKPHSSPLHPTQKPVDLIQRCVRNITERGDTILDPFLGSGTTLIAAEAEGRVCYGMELKPRYVDVICARWEGLTGIKPTRNGEPVTFLAEAE